MSRTQRIVVILYCILLVYCCLWVPWHLVQGPDRVRAGYGWLWVGPSNPEAIGSLTTPDLAIVSLRLMAATAISGAAFLSAGMFKDGSKR